MAFAVLSTPPCTPACHRTPCGAGDSTVPPPRVRDRLKEPAELIQRPPAGGPAGARPNPVVGNQAQGRTGLPWTAGLGGSAGAGARVPRFLGWCSAGHSLLLSLPLNGGEGRSVSRAHGGRTGLTRGLPGGEGVGVVFLRPQQEWQGGVAGGPWWGTGGRLQRLWPRWQLGGSRQEGAEGTAAIGTGAGRSSRPPPLLSDRVHPARTSAVPSRSCHPSLGPCPLLVASWPLFLAWPVRTRFPYPGEEGRGGRAWWEGRASLGAQPPGSWELSSTAAC